VENISCLGEENILPNYSAIFTQFHLPVLPDFLIKISGNFPPLLPRKRNSTKIYISYKRGFTPPIYDTLTRKKGQFIPS